MKSDRRTRALVLALCIAPVAAPLLAAGISNLMKSSAPSVVAPAPSPDASPPPLRRSLHPSLPATFDKQFLSPKPMSSDERLQSKPAPKPMSSDERLQSKPAPKPQAMIASPRVNGSHVLREVNIVDGLHLAAEGMTIALAGVTSVPPGSECRRLDDVVEACAVRAANRLDVLTRGRPVVCELQDGDGGELRGVCRAGKIDLAEDLVRNGLAVRTSDAR